MSFGSSPSTAYHPEANLARTTLCSVSAPNSSEYSQIALAPGPLSTAHNFCLSSFACFSGAAAGRVFGTAPGASASSKQ
eukprot:2143056-Pyramimonas_sp.AAC.1